MSDEPDSLVLRYLRRLDEKLDRVVDELSDVKRRLTSLEQAVARLHADFSGQSARIELRLDLSDAPA